MQVLKGRKPRSAASGGLAWFASEFRTSREMWVRIGRMVLWITGLACSLQGCVSKGKPIATMGTPQFVPQSQPDSLLETGIGQDPSTGGIVLQWYTIQGAAGCKLYRAATTEANGMQLNFMIVGDVSSSLNDTSMVDNDSITVGVNYLYYLRAYAADGALSTPSDTLQYKLMHRPELTRPIPGSIASVSGLYFQWVDHDGNGYTIIRLIDLEKVPTLCIWLTKRFRSYGGYPSRNFDFDSVAIDDVVAGRSYKWRVDRFDVDSTSQRIFEGSRSPWETFTAK